MNGSTMRALFPPSIVTQSESMFSLIDRTMLIAHSDSTILYVGETGVGKELFAHLAHCNSNRKGRPLVKVSLSSIPADLLESELFGHEKGAFTHAIEKKVGLFELAHMGTIFLDDIDDVPMSTQAKLLRVLESREIMRVGGIRTIPVDIRLIVASKVDLRSLVRQGAFREDLFYRINVFPVLIPPLRNRREDILPLFEYFVRQFAPQSTFCLTASAKRVLLEYSWPGNVRELRNVAEHATLLAKTEISLQELSPELYLDGQQASVFETCRVCMIDHSLRFREAVECLEKHMLWQALIKANGNRTRAARSLGLSLSTLWDKVRKYNLQV